MEKSSEFLSSQIFEYFKEICSIPHGSGNMKKISSFCVDFAKKHNLEVVCDDAKNVIIYKAGTSGYENSAPIILQGHLDMVCQKDANICIDFEKDGLEIFTHGDYIHAKGTTLGADNGIAVAMILTILASDTLSHPPIEAVFTTDEEIGMIGASALDASLLKSKKMINIDSEDFGTLTVSCAGGSDFIMHLPFSRKVSCGKKVVLSISGLTGGHSGVEIDKGRINANILMGRILGHMSLKTEFEIIKLNGGTKGNAIPVSCEAELLVSDAQRFVELVNSYFSIIKNEVSSRESLCSLTASIAEEGTFNVLDDVSKDKLIYMLSITPNGVIDMSHEIEGLVETSLNLGVLSTDDNKIIMHYTLRSNKSSALRNLEEKLSMFAKHNALTFEIRGAYMPWEFKNNSALQELYIDEYFKALGKKPNVVSIHAGLECGVFASKIADLDCISVGPDMFDIHSTNERLSISSTKELFDLLCTILEKSK